LIASDLFGHEKRAFTGALQRRLGRFELAEGGLDRSVAHEHHLPRKTVPVLRPSIFLLNSVSHRNPPLRDRLEDIPLLVEYFIGRYASKAGKKICNIHKRTLELFQSYPWPGNLRELQNVIERSVIVCEDETLSVDKSWLSKESDHSQAVAS
jgi:DNA-binding NtrC family response regulator